MLSRDQRCSRRKFLASAAALSLGTGAAASSRGPALPASSRRPIAVLGSVYRPLSYLYHVAGRFLHGYPRDGVHHLPAYRIESLWVDQVPENDLARETCRSFAIRRARTISEALRVGDRLAVDGVLIVIEHGNYPRNSLGQILYPKAEIFDQVADVFRSVGQSVPVYVAKHLSHDFAKAQRMVQSAAELGFPLMAGSVLPTTDRIPNDAVPAAQPNSETLVAGFGPTEVFGFDAVEALQSLVERRSNGLPGVTAVSCLSGADVWKAADNGLWNWKLLDAALACGETVNLGDVRKNVGAIALPNMPAGPPIAFLIEYADHTRGTVLLLNGHLQEFVAAADAGASVPFACRFVTPPAPGVRHFDRHVAAIEQFLVTNRSSEPLARTLLSTGMLQRLLESHSLRGQRVLTPELTAIA